MPPKKKKSGVVQDAIMKLVDDIKDTENEAKILVEDAKSMRKELLKYMKDHGHESFMGHRHKAVLQESSETVMKTSTKELFEDIGEERFFPIVKVGIEAARTNLHESEFLKHFKKVLKKEPILKIM